MSVCLLVKITSLPDNLTEFGKKILIDIASGAQNLSSLPDCFKNIIARLDKRKIKSTITNIRNEFCNGTKTINAAKFQFFEPWFRLHGNLSSRAGEVVDKIIKPVITEPACRTLVLENDKFYITLINQGGDDSFDLKQICQQWIQRETEDTKLIEFLKGIGVESMTEK